MISHRNVISNVMQIGTYESVDRNAQGQNGKPRMDVVLGLLPQSHIYGLVVICAAATYRGGTSTLEEFWMLVRSGLVLADDRFGT
jgi:acyl-CoA synthetase (AMP-forming)/AMP-acid ligase II